MNEFKKVNEIHEIQTVVKLAKEIMHEHYGSYIPTHHIDYFLEEYQSFAKITEQINQNYIYYLIQNKNLAVGYFGLKMNTDLIEISKIYIQNSRRGLRLGEKSIQYIIILAEKLKIDQIELVVNQNNNRAISFYKRLQFNIIEAKTTTYGNGHSEDDYLMRRIIQA